MNGFVIYTTYRVDAQGAKVHLFGRLENGESFQAIKSFRPYFYIKDSQKDVFQAFATPIRFEVQESPCSDFKGNKLARIVLVNPQEVPALRDDLLKRQVDCYEADIRFTYRFLMDYGIKGGIALEGPHKKGGFVDRVYLEPDVSSSDADIKLKVLSLDIETEGRARMVYSVGFSSGDYKKVLMISPDPLKNAQAVPDERTLLQKAFDEIRAFDPDLIIGWNLIDFDFKVLSERCRALGVPFSLSRVDGWHTNLKINTEFLKDSEIEIPGRLALDGIQMVKSSFVKLEDYKLDTAAKTLLGEQKTIEFQNKQDEIDQLFLKDKETLAVYNLKDTELVYRIIMEKGILDLTIARTRLTGMLLDRVKASVASLDSLYLRETRKRNIVCNSTRVQDREERIKGGFVMESKPGIYEMVSVFDFKSLYPSIIRTFNIDPLSFSPTGEIVAPNGARFRNEEGILPKLITELWAKRDDAKRRKNQIESNAIKITMNSFFGVLANPACRFYSLEMANGITSFGQMIIKKTAEMLSAKGFTVIYGDTDSLFVKFETKQVEEAERLSKELIKDINAFYADFIPKTYGRESCLELQYEKTFIKFIMPRVRDSDTGSKKRYAGMLIKDGKEKITFTGLEFVRRDWTEAAKNFQLKLLDLVFHEKDLRSFIKQYAADLREGRLDDQLVYKKALRKDVRTYTKTTPPHVKAARQLEKIDNPVISYYQTMDGPQPLGQVRSKIDYDHYIEKQIRPIADTILGFYNESFDSIVSKTKQQTLFGF